MNVQAAIKSVLFVKKQATHNRYAINMGNESQKKDCINPRKWQKLIASITMTKKYVQVQSLSKIDVLLC